MDLNRSTGTGCSTFSKCSVSSLPFLGILINDFLLLLYSGRLIRTLAELNYHKHRMSRVEIVYNVISVIVAVVFMIGFAIYARRALENMESSEGIYPEPIAASAGTATFRNEHQGCSTVRSVPIGVV